MQELEQGSAVPRTPKTSRRHFLTRGTLGLAGLYALACKRPLPSETPGPVNGLTQTSTPASSVASASPQTAEPMKLTLFETAHHVAFSSQGLLAATEYLLTPKLYVWDASKGTLLYEVSRRDLGCDDLLFSPDGRLLAVQHSLNPYYNKDLFGVQLFDLSQKMSSVEIGRVGVDYSAMAFSPDSKLLALLIDRVGQAPPGVELWDLASGRLVKTLSLGEYDFVDRLAFSKDGTRLMGYFSQRTFTWNLSTYALSKEQFTHGQGTLNTRFSRDGSLCLGYINAFTDQSYDRDKEFYKLRLFDTKDYRLRWELDGLPVRQLREVALSPDGGLLALSCHASALKKQHLDIRYSEDVQYEVKVFDLRSDKEIFSLPNASFSSKGLGFPTRPNEEIKLEFSPDSKRLAVYGWDNSVQLWKLS